MLAAAAGTGIPAAAASTGGAGYRCAPQTAYVGKYYSVTPIGTRTGTAGPAIPAGYDPETIAITPDGSTAYVATGSGVMPISTRTNTVGPTIHVGGRPEYIAITPEGRNRITLSTTHT